MATATHRKADCAHQHIGTIPVTSDWVYKEAHCYADPATMWPFGNSEVINTNVTAHDVASYSMDGAFIVVAIIAVLYWRWGRQQGRIKELEAASRRSRIAADV